MYVVYRRSHCRQCGTRLKLGLSAWRIVTRAPGHGARHHRRGTERVCPACGVKSYYRPRTMGAWNLTIPVVALVLGTLASLLLFEVAMAEQDFNTFGIRLGMALGFGLLSTVTVAYLGKCSQKKVT